MNEKAPPTGLIHGRVERGRDQPRDRRAVRIDARARQPLRPPGSERPEVAFRSLVALLVLALAALSTVAVAGARTNVPGSTVVTVLAGKPSELKFKLSVNAVKRGTVVFKVTNKGLLPHDFKICSSPHGGLANSCAGKGTPVISPGKSATLKYTFKKAGTYEYLCTMPGHAAGGMKGDLKVT